MKARLDLIKFIDEFSARLNSEFLVSPDIRIIFGDEDVNGACNVLYHWKDMHIAIKLPWTYEYTDTTRTELICLITHEYAHYLWSLKLSADERVRDSKRYSTDDTFRRHDEYKTWKQTKRMLQYLDLWTDEIMRTCNQFRYAHVIMD